MHLFFNVFADLIVNLKFLFEIIELLLFNFTSLDSLFARRDGRREKVEEGFCRVGFSHQSCAICVCHSSHLT